MSIGRYNYLGIDSRDVIRDMVYLAKHIARQGLHQGWK